MHATFDTVLAHHKAAASMWDAGGRGYDEISFGISDALAHAAQRLNPKAGQKILDVATGTGWSARNAARMGADVTAIDISADLLSAAKELSATLEPRIDFQLADAERLPFSEGTFDGIISTFGVMFAANHAQAAAELARACKKGGRLSLATWVPGGAVAEFFGIVAKHADAPPPEESPLAWGDPDHVTKLLGEDFELTFERGWNNAYYDDVDEIWDWFARGFGPVKQLLGNLDAAGRAAFKSDVDAYHSHYQTEAGLHVKREYLVVIGRRR
jgi:SAM-dependent methyltransferase